MEWKDIDSHKNRAMLICMMMAGLKPMKSATDRMEPEIFPKFRGQKLREQQEHE